MLLSGIVPQFLHNQFKIQAYHGPRTKRVRATNLQEKNPFEKRKSNIFERTMRRAAETL